MSAFLGLWALEGGAPGRREIERARDVVKAACGAAQRETALGRLWLGGDERMLAGRGAAAGFLPSGAAAAVAAASSLDALRVLPGHFVVAAADDDGLTLYRDAGGGERLFWLRRDGLLWFSCSARLLAAAARLGIDAGSALQFLFNGGSTLDYGATLWDGLRELRAGQALTARGPRVELGPQAVMPKPDDRSPETTARDLRVALETAVEQAVEGRREIAVALTGGADSSVMAALACRALGADRVAAYTFELDDPSRPSEAGAAAAVCERLGIARRRVVRVTEASHRRGLPEAVWRADEPGSLRGIGLVQELARAAADDGQTALLTGAGMEALLRVPLSRNRYLNALAAEPPSDAALWDWKARRYPGESRGWPLFRRTARPLPPDPLYFMVLSVLWRAGRVKDVGAYYPKDLADLARRAAASAAAALDESREASLQDQLGYRYYASHVLSMNLQRKVKLSRELGCTLVAPATFPVCAMGTGRWSARTDAARPKALLAEAAAGLVPEEILSQAKNEVGAVIPESWAAGDARALAPLERAQRPLLESAIGASLEAAARRLPETARLALWRRVSFVDDPARTPSWDAVVPAA